MALPNSAADPREGGKPAYIAADCPTCNTKLVLLDHIEHPTMPEDQIWHDEWTCPKCQDGIWLDWPEGYEKEQG